MMRQLALFELTEGNCIVSNPYQTERPVPSIYLDGTTDPLVPFTSGQMISGDTAGGTIISEFSLLLSG